MFVYVFIVTRFTVVCPLQIGRVTFKKTNEKKNRKNQDVPHCCWKDSVPMLGSGACSLFWSYLRPLIFLLFGIN